MPAQPNLGVCGKGPDFQSVNGELVNLRAAYKKTDGDAEFPGRRVVCQFQMPQDATDTPRQNRADDKMSAQPRLGVCGKGRRFPIGQRWACQSARGLWETG